jgi:hypothetical protein
MLKKYYHYGATPNTYDMLKVLAMIAMVVDHVGVYYFEGEQIFRIIGRIAMPCFLFLVGYSSKWNNKKDIYIMAALLLAFYAATSGPILPLNILFSIIVTRMMLGFLEKKGWIGKTQWMFVIALVLYVPFLFLLDLTVFNFLFALGGYYVKHYPLQIKTQVLLLSAATLYFLEESFWFGFEGYYAYGLALLLYTMAGIFYLFSLEQVPEKKGVTWLFPVLMFISRYSLYLYVAHLIIIRGIDFYIDPEHYAHFRLLR